MATQHIVTAAAVKVSIGSAGGNRIAQFLRRGDVLPEGLAEEQLERLANRNLIQAVEVEDIEDADAAEEQSEVVTIPDGVPNPTWTVPQIDAFAEAKDIDLTGPNTKPEKLAAIAAALGK